MKIKRVIAAVLAGICCMNLIAGSASAHDEDIYGGSYIGKTKADFVLRINSSARTDILTYSDVYQHGYDWNNISGNVQLGVAVAGGGMPSIADQINVNGCDLLSSNAQKTYGRSIYYDKNWNECGPSADCYAAKIEMNTSENVYSNLDNLSDKQAMAKKVFVHEVGHILKLRHPWQSSKYEVYSGHDYGGYPYAIMNMGDLWDEPCSADEITEHDKSCLIKKWGN